MPTVAERLLTLIEARGVRQAFGIPGNHTLALYEALGKTEIRHITCRHEQAAGFMADGYARACGRPALALLISGPGLANAATPMGQALADCIPMLVVTSVRDRALLGRVTGTLHELPDQAALAASVSRASFTLDDPARVEEIVARAFGLMNCSNGSPGPVHIQVPMDVMSDRVIVSSTAPETSSPAAPEPAAIDALAAQLDAAEAPILLIGGGCKDVRSLVALAERLDTPVVNTTNAKGVVPASHPLAAGGSPSLPSVQRALGAADVVLAIGTELGETDYDLLMGDPLHLNGCLARIDLDPKRLHVPIAADHALAADAERACAVLLDRAQPRSRQGRERAAAIRAEIRDEPHYHPEFAALFACMQTALPDALVVGDSTRPTYYATWMWESEAPRRYFHSVSGFGTLGYAIPAAIGAKRACPELPVVCLIGDGGAQFTLPELATAADNALPVIFIIWQNQGYEEITNSMRARGIDTDTTDVGAPDFAAIAAACRCRAAAPRTLEALGGELRHAAAATEPTVIVLQQDDFIATPSGQWYGQS